MFWEHFGATLSCIADGDSLQWYLRGSLLPEPEMPQVYCPGLTGGGPRSYRLPGTPIEVVFMSISKRLRFEIFKRDGFRCSYCGATPEISELRVDHVTPRAKGGSDDPDNLATSCHDCNAGKSDIPLCVSKYAGMSSFQRATIAAVERAFWKTALTPTREEVCIDLCAYEDTLSEFQWEPDEDEEAWLDAHWGKL